MSDSLSELMEVLRAARTVLREADVVPWMARENPLLNDKKPIDMVRDGEAYKVLALIEGLADGVVL